MSHENQSETRPRFEFFGGEFLLLAKAPDDPTARYSTRHNENTWSFVVTTAKGKSRGSTAVLASESAEAIFRNVEMLLYGNISSSEVYERTEEVRAWIDQIHAAYQTRINEAN